jgi:hypothetical protein
MNAINHKPARFKLASVGTNGIAEYKSLSKTRTVPCQRHAPNINIPLMAAGVLPTASIPTTTAAAALVEVIYSYIGIGVLFRFARFVSMPVKQNALVSGQG